MSTDQQKRDLFLAILALGSYNRGYGQGIELDDGLGQADLQIGNASIVDEKGDLPAQNIGFYASAYMLNGQSGFTNGDVVISYRGTNANSAEDMLKDVFNGWTAGAGFSSSVQVGMAMEFYKQVTGVTSLYDAPVSNLTLTGHSLGGGLAGFVSSLTGTN